MLKVIRKIASDPFNSVVHLIAYLRGLYYILYFGLFKSNVKIKFPFTAFASVKIVGPGSVFMGKNCYVFKNVFKGLTIVTHCPDSSVIIGNECQLGGVTIRCRNHIEIGDKTMTAISLVQDSFFINQNKADLLPAQGPYFSSKRTIIGMNVWLGAGSTVIGSCIGRDAVLSAGAGCYGAEIDEYCLVIGSPAKKPLPIERLLRLKGSV